LFRDSVVSCYVGEQQQQPPMWHGMIQNSGRFADDP
jgi:hypothetical protein